MELKLGYGKEKVAVTVPDENLLAVLRANEVGNIKPAGELIRDALENPIGTPKLREIVKKGEKIVIITSDLTRPMPSSVVLPYVLEELGKAGIPDGDIEVVFGVGSHRSHTEEEMRYMVGDGVFDRVRCVDSNTGKYIRVGTTTMNNTPVDVFEDVLEADRRICLGNIEFHWFAGYSGGGKAIMPAVCSRDSIQVNHKLMVQDTSCAGAIETNKLRMDIEEAADMVGVDFILNVVLDEAKNVCCAVCGDHRKAHREGVKFLDKMYKTPIPKKADIVLVSPAGYPKDINLYQAQKALDNARHAVRDGGIVILAGSCKEGLGEATFERWITTAKTSRQMIDDIQTNFELGGHKAAAFALVLEKARIFLVSDLEPAFIKKIFMEPFAGIPAALQKALEEMGKDASVIVMPYGGSTLPVVEG